MCIADGIMLQAVHFSASTLADIFTGGLFIHIPPIDKLVISQCRTNIFKNYFGNQ
jgi:hypothetical protein